MSLLKIAIASLVVGLIGLTSSAGPKESTRERGESSAGPGDQPLIQDIAMDGGAMPEAQTASGSSAEFVYKPLIQGITMEQAESNVDRRLLGPYKRFINYYKQHLTGISNMTTDGCVREISIPNYDDVIAGLRKYEMNALKRMRNKMNPNGGAMPEVQAASESSAEFVYKPLIQGITMEQALSNVDRRYLGAYKRYIRSYKQHWTGKSNMTTDGYVREIRIPNYDDVIAGLRKHEMNALIRMRETMEANGGAMPEAIAASASQPLREDLTMNDVESNLHWKDDAEYRDNVERYVERQMLQAIAQMESGSSVSSIYHPLTPHLTLEALVSNLNHNLLSEWLRSLQFLYLYATGQVNQQNFPQVDHLRLRVFEIEESAINKIQRKIDAIAASGWSEYQPLRGDVTMNDVNSNLHWKDLAEYRDNFEYLHMHRTPETEDPIKLSNIPSEENVIKNIIRLETVAINNKREAQPPTSTSGGGAN